MTEDQIDAFVIRLSEANVGERAFNQYELGKPDNQTRRNNLKLYLRQMSKAQPTVALIGEAPSYRGMRLTGVPFGSRRVVCGGLDSLGLFGSERGYLPAHDHPEILSEQSATIVWGVLSEIGRAPLIWNSFPFHPFQPDKPLSNRLPSRDELLLGAGFLKTLLWCFNVDRVIAVGNTASKTLSGLGVASQKIRHPAQGGKNDFVAGIRRILAK